MTGVDCGTRVDEKVMKQAGDVFRFLKSGRREHNRRNTIKRLVNITINDLYKEEQDTITKGAHTNTLKLLKNKWRDFLGVIDVRGERVIPSAKVREMINDIKEELHRGPEAEKDKHTVNTDSQQVAEMAGGARRLSPRAAAKAAAAAANLALKEEIKHQVTSIIMKIKEKMKPHSANSVKLDDRQVALELLVDARLHKSLFDWIKELRGADPWVDGFTAAELITSQIFDINIPQNQEHCHGPHCIWVSASTIKSAMT